MRADAAQDAEDALDEQRRTDHLAVQEMTEVVQVADVVALALESGVVLRAGAEDLADVLEGVLEHQVAAVLQVVALPLVLELLVAVQHREQAEVDRSHVQRCHLGLQLHRRPHALVDAHVRAATRGQVDHGIGAAPDLRQEAREDVRILGGPAVVGIARVDVEDGRARLGGTDRRLGDLVGIRRQMG